MAIVEQWELRAEFARRLSVMYGKEVPAETEQTVTAAAHGRVRMQGRIASPPGSGVTGRPLHDPYDLYDSIRRRSLSAVAERLGISGEIEIPTPAMATEGQLQ